MATALASIPTRRKAAKQTISLRAFPRLLTHVPNVHALDGFSAFFSHFLAFSLCPSLVALRSVQLKLFVCSSSQRAFLPLNLLLTTLLPPPPSCWFPTPNSRPCRTHASTHQKPPPTKALTIGCPMKSSRFRSFFSSIGAELHLVVSSCIANRPWPLCSDAVLGDGSSIALWYASLVSCNANGLCRPNGWRPPPPCDSSDLELIDFDE